MKNFFLVLSLIPFSLFGATENPITFCDQNPFCTQKMHDITSDYKVGNNKFSKEAFSGASGGCYHISSLYDSNHEHHGAFIFEQLGRELLVDGIFTFFYEQDPFASMTALELKAWFISKKSQMVKAIKKKKEIELQFLGDQSDYHYWFRNNKQGDKLIIIGKQQGADYLGFLFCEMNLK